MNDTRSTIDAEARKDPARLEREIDQQRDHIGGLIEALESRVSPHEVFDRVMAYGKDNGGEIARNFGAVVKTNPVPALLAATGLLWLYSSRNQPPPQNPALRSRFGAYRASSSGSSAHDSAYDGAYGGDPSAGMDRGGQDHGRHLGEGLKERAWHMREGASHLRESASGKWRDTTHRLGEGMHHARDSVQHRAMAARGGFEHMLEDNPMAAGAIAVAVGALLGAALPTSEPERRMLGPVGGKLSGKAREVADAAREKGREGLDAVREMGEPSQASSTKGDSGSTLGGGTSA